MMIKRVLFFTMLCYVCINANAVDKDYVLRNNVDYIFENDSILYRFKSSKEYSEPELCRYDETSEVEVVDIICGGDVVIPDEVTYKGFKYKVISIGSYYRHYPLPGVFDMYTSVCFFGQFNKSPIKSITIGNGINSIPNGLFSNCSELSFINVLEGNEVYDSRDNCNAVIHTSTNTLIAPCKNTVIPNSVTCIGANAYTGCKYLKTITIPNGVINIDKTAFYECSNLTSVSLPNSLTNIGNAAFKGCISLTSVVIPNSVTTIGERVFAACSSLSSLTIGSGLTTISKSAFEECYALESVIIPNNISVIEDNAFHDKLKSIIIGSGVTEIGTSAFRAYKTIWLPSKKPNFYGLKGSIHYASTNYLYNMGEVIVYPHLSSMFEDSGVYYVPVSPSERTCDVINCVYDKTVDHIAINKTVSYKGVNMTVNKVMPGSFYKNEYIKDVKLDFEGEVLDSAFLKCFSLKSVYLGDGVTKLGTNTFWDCKALETVHLGQNIIEIGNNAFRNCNLSGGKVIIPNSLKSIGISAFLGSSIKSVDLGNNIEEIKGSTFSDCHFLSDIKFGENVKTIGNSAFHNCTSLTTLTIPNSIAKIERYSFSGCSSLRNIIIETDTNNVDLLIDGYERKYGPLSNEKTEKVFTDCPLDSVFIGRNRIIGERYLYGYPYRDCITLRTVYYADNVTNIPNWEFSGCTNLKNVRLGDGMKTIGHGAFYNCMNIEAFSINRNVTSIDEEAFFGCRGITKLISNSSIPPTCGKNALTDINKWNCTLYVPANSISLYQAADQWKDFFFIESIDNIPSAINSLQDQQTMVQASDGNIEISGVVDGVLVTAYSVDGKKLASTVTMNGMATLKTKMPKGGMAIVRVGDKVMKIVMK